MNSEKCLKWGGSGVIKESQLKLLKREWIKAEIVRRGERVLKESQPLPPLRKILIVHHGILSVFSGIQLFLYSAETMYFSNEK